MSLDKQINKLGWAELAVLEQMCINRRMQLSKAEDNVYLIRIKDGEYKYLGIIDGKFDWGPLNNPQLAVYPIHSFAEGVRVLFDGAGVMAMPKAEFVGLPVCKELQSVQTVDSEGNWLK